ncbi:predicted protein [Candida tropicalis MYA-3404]|uniref:U6 snRNA phosphodiesterase n=1 Tax=Candida tropicalis (strain ATCC MYA-3404 / T1) TaxID=294747 RepID=C5MAH3_CANTT|nr:predicted protein [Candida tropicalis MYA-3404]EER32640.1 predicted protein [Candida tropicalis MYA-3404]KAG4406464.1 hypothetical protein JTP64_003848 [Candida tropicalis]
MDLIQQYQSDSESESEFESEREEEVGLNKEQENNPKVNNQEKCESESSLPPLPRIEIYSQQYQQNMSLKEFSSYCYLPWNPSLPVVRTLDKVCEKVIQTFPELSKNYKFVQPHKDISREVKHHISVTYSFTMPIDKADHVLPSMMKKFSKVEIPQSLVQEIGGSSSPLIAIMNKKRKGVRFSLNDHLTVRGSGSKIFLCADLNSSDESQQQLCKELRSISKNVLLENGIQPPPEGTFLSPPHVSVSIGYLKGKILSKTDIRKINSKLTGIKFRELQDVNVDVEEIHCIRPPQKEVIPVHSQRLL